MEHPGQLELIALDRHADNVGRAAEARLLREASLTKAKRAFLLSFFTVFTVFAFIVLMGSAAA
jgi:hypothetical protein